jgi:UDP-N-acetylglucosamine--dolichyl-phosphate N-acetylglucosaminephosphotransferase
MIPVIAEYTMKRGIAGKDMGKKGSARESVDVPEALGIVPGIVFIICAIFTQLMFAKDDHQLVVYNSGLFSVCFMIFLGFLDDTLDLKWRYKLFLPMIASMPLLSAYSGSTSMYLPKPLTFLLMNDGKLTIL